jgi:gluconolactonase
MNPPVILAIVASCIALSHCCAAGGAEPIIATGEHVQKLAGDFLFAEGAASDAQGNVYFTDQPNDRILFWNDAEQKLSTFMQPAGRSNGLCFDREGKLLACADEKNELWRIDPATKHITVLVKDYAGKLLNGPNDVWVNPIRGGAYLTDPFYKRSYWKRADKQQDEAVYFLSADDSKLLRVADDLKQPNGIVGTPDGKRLYVSDIKSGQTWQYDIEDDAALTNKKLFCTMGSDGMTIDSAGNVYLTGRGVTVFDPTGRQIEHIDVPEAWTGNVCFGGKDRKTLFITASKGLYAIRLNVKGVGSS